MRELAELMEGFNLMQREVQGERDAVAAAARREAAQRTERQLWETVQSGLLPSACRASGVSASPRATSRPSGRCWWAATSTTPSRWSTGGSR